jgi:hypothetical protein
MSYEILKILIPLLFLLPSLDMRALFDELFFSFPLMFFQVRKDCLPFQRYRKFVADFFFFLALNAFTEHELFFFYTSRNRILSRI